MRGILSNEISRFTESPGRPRDRDAAAGGQDNDMLWEYEPQPGGSSVLDSEEYASLILEMEQALYEDARRDLEARGWLVSPSCQPEVLALFLCARP